MFKNKFFYLIFVLTLFFSCRKDPCIFNCNTNIDSLIIPNPKDTSTSTKDTTNLDSNKHIAPFNNVVSYKHINPLKYLASLQFDGTDNFDGGEKSFPIPFDFNTSQDANNDGSIDVEDNLENFIPFAIGDNLYGTGRTGLSNRGPNKQRPAVYFHFSRVDSFNVYEYWLYYADNDWLNDHEHDWEKYFVYEVGNTPLYIKISNHINFFTFSWNSINKDAGHPLIAVDGGSHAMKNGVEDGVLIRFNGDISSNNGQLVSGNGQNFNWLIYSNDNNVIGATNYIMQPDTFFMEILNI